MKLNGKLRLSAKHRDKLKDIAGWQRIRRIYAPRTYKPPMPPDYFATVVHDRKPPQRPSLFKRLSQWRFA